MVGVYLSGTGNTKHCIQKLVHSLDETAQAIPIEKPEAAQELSRHDFIILAYPVQFSNIPVMVRDFIKQHGDLWKDKQVLCVATMALFSGDGAGCSARLLKTYGAKVVGGLHIQMPDSICDEKLLKRPAAKIGRPFRLQTEKSKNGPARSSRADFPKTACTFTTGSQAFWDNGFGFPKRQRTIPIS